MKTGEEETRVEADRAFVSMSWEEDTRHTVLLGTTLEEFGRTSRIYAGYWTVHNSQPYNHVCGGGRPFSAVCLNTDCGQVLEKMTT